MQAGRHLGIANVNDQITQSQSVGLLPMPRSGSRLDPINENNNANPIMHDVVAPTITNHNLGATGPGNQNFNKNITSNLSSNRTGLAGRGLGGVGGSIISSSGIN